MLMLIDRHRGEGPPLLQGVFRNEFGHECLMEVIGKHHPACSQFANPGEEFMSMLDLED